MNLESLARALIAGALLLLVAGAVLYLLAKLGLPRLPGDLVFEGKRWRVVLPIATSILLSLVLTVLLNIGLRFFR